MALSAARLSLACLASPEFAGVSGYALPRRPCGHQHRDQQCSGPRGHQPGVNRAAACGCCSHAQLRQRPFGFQLAHLVRIQGRHAGVHPAFEVGIVMCGHGV